MAISSKPERVEVEQHIADNYDALYREGREYETMAAEAERMNDRKLAAHLRGRAEDVQRDTAPKERQSAADKKDGASK